MPHIQHIIFWRLLIHEVAAMVVLDQETFKDVFVRPFFFGFRGTITAVFQLIYNILDIKASSPA